MIAMDGMWFLSVLKELGPEKTIKIDEKVISGQFKFTTRLARQTFGLDGVGIDDKVKVMESIARFYGHTFEVLTDQKSVTMRLVKCSIYENLKKAGRLLEHDCTRVCQYTAKEWFKELEPRTQGAGHTDFQIPKGGKFCDWTIGHPEEKNKKILNIE